MADGNIYCIMLHSSMLIISRPIAVAVIKGYCGNNLAANNHDDVINLGRNTLNVGVSAISENNPKKIDTSGRVFFWQSFLTNIKACSYAEKFVLRVVSTHALAFPRS